MTLYLNPVKNPNFGSAYCLGLKKKSQYIISYMLQNVNVYSEDGSNY